MNGRNDLLDDILPMVICGILDPKYITGEEPPKEKSERGRTTIQNRMTGIAEKRAPRNA